MNRREIECEDSQGLGQGVVVGCYGHSNEPSGSMQGSEFLV
jgi:hypothetical protein